MDGEVDRVQPPADAPRIRRLGWTGAMRFTALIG